MKLRNVLVPVALAAALAACATAPQPLQGEFTAITPREAVDRAHVYSTIEQR